MLNKKNKFGNGCSEKENPEQNKYIIRASEEERRKIENVHNMKTGDRIEGIFGGRLTRLPNGFLFNPFLDSGAISQQFFFFSFQEFWTLT